jgi:hypothetical protein
MEKIPETFNRQDYSYKLLIRENNNVIYEVRRTWGICCYEVMIVKIQKPMIWKAKNKDGTINEIKYEEKEKLPGDEQFGSLGWTYDKYDNAIKKFEELKKKDLNSKNFKGEKND